ncbi:MAG TPA: hypothetical protein PLJ57_05285 [Tepidanaerobacteraceae bacterium]|nr:hypothetical protein [Tepidanaerobacteraceae bacterium]
MEIRVAEIIPEKDILVKDVFSRQGILLLRAGTKLTRKYKELLHKQNVKTVYVA